jgi:hypothetical protein
MTQIVADPKLVAYCGLYCGACGAHLKGRCPGCHQNQRASWCKVRICCLTNALGSCADCKEHDQPSDCKKFNNIISKLFGLIFRSDRAACIRQIKQLGIQCHAENMAQSGRQSIKRGA